MSKANYAPLDPGLDQAATLLDERDAGLGELADLRPSFAIYCPAWLLRAFDHAYCRLVGAEARLRAARAKNARMERECRNGGQ